MRELNSINDELRNIVWHPNLKNTLAIIFANKILLCLINENLSLVVKKEINFCHIVSFNWNKIGE